MNDEQLAAEDKGAIDIASVEKTVAWLEEQRHHDQDILARLAQETDRSALQLMEFANQIRSLAEDVRIEQEHTTRFIALGETVNQLRDNLTQLQQQNESAFHERDHNISALQTDSSRSQVVLAELSQLVRETSQRSENMLERINLLAHEGKNDRAVVVDNNRRLETYANRLEGFAGKLQLMEEQVRRYDGRINGLERDLGLLSTELERRRQWEQAAEIRWARQTTEIKSGADEWQRAVEEQNRVLNASTKQFTQLSSEIQGLYKRLAEGGQQTEERVKDVKRVEATVKMAQEDIGRLRQSFDDSQHKFDAQIKNLRQLEEVTRQSDEKFAALHRALDFQQERIDTMGALLGQADQRQVNELSELVETQQRVIAHNEQIEQELAGLRRTLAEQWDRVKLALTQQRQLEEQHQARKVAELQRHIQELRGSENNS